MYNEDLVQVVIDKYGRQQALIYCQIEYDKNDMIYRELKSSKKVPQMDIYEVSYERQWWEERLKKLKNEEDAEATYYPPERW
jgi:hypothetical protein